MSLAISADGSRIAAVTNKPPHLLLWDRNGALLLDHDLEDRRPSPSGGNPYRFRDLYGGLLALSADGSWVAWTDPAAAKDLALGGHDAPWPRSNGDHGLDAALWRVRGDKLEPAGHHAWVRMTPDTLVTADAGGRVVVRDIKTADIQWQLQVYPNGAWVRWSDPTTIERSPNSAAAITWIGSEGITDLTPRSPAPR